MSNPMEVAMARADEILRITAEMDTVSFLRYLIAERFPRATVATCSLRARSVVVLKMISEIAPSTPIVFCHMPNLYPESLAYRAKLVSDLGLRDIREPGEDHGVLPGDCNHSEGLWAENPVDHTRAYRTVHLNQALSGFECWISAVYHGPYPDVPGPRVREEGRLIRIDPLASWTQSQVRDFMREHGLSYHPRAILDRSQLPEEEPGSVVTFAY
ncbi:MAG: phosphoadenosine phosphosulfate reductase family protein [Hyphomicrobiaceae bacterium]